MEGKGGGYWGPRRDTVLATREVPDDWRIANFVFLFKKGSRDWPGGSSREFGRQVCFVIIFQAIWKSILSNVDTIEDTTDFFKSGAASMDVVRLVEEIKQKCKGLQLQNEDVYMATKFEDFIQMIVRKLRGEDKEEELEVDYVTMDVNDMTVKMPHQCFIDGRFTNAEEGKTYNTINPTNGSVICEVSYSSVADVDRAVAAAKDAFENGQWGKMNARDRGRLLY
eukprot:g39291.t1